MSREHLGNAREPLDEFRPSPARARVSADAPGEHERERDGGDVHFGAHRADRRDEIDHPADLGFGLGIAEPVVLRPGASASMCSRFGPCSAVTPKLLGDEGHERMQQLEDLVEHPGRRRARFGLGGAIRAGEHRL